MRTAVEESRGSITRERIVHEAVQLFSFKGFYNTSLEDILQATGLSKGGFFAHFKSKEELGYAAIDKAVAIWMEKVLPVVKSKSDPLEKLLAIIDGHCFLAEAQTFKGGCFFLTLGTEMDDQHEHFRRKLSAIFKNWAKFIVRILEEGKAKGIFKKNIQTEEIANFIIATVEGTVLLGKVNRDKDLFTRGMKNLKRLLTDSIVR